MTPVDTSQTLIVYPETTGNQSIFGGPIMALFGLVGLWAGLQQGRVVLALLTALLVPLGMWMSWVYQRRYTTRAPDAPLKLTPEGLHFLTGPMGLVPWPDLRAVHIKGGEGDPSLAIHIDKAAHGRLDTTEGPRRSAKLDTDDSRHALTIQQHKLEMPVFVLADVLHQYSLAHGGPALLQPDP